jgi:hypothetical protein
LPARVVPTWLVIALALTVGLAVGTLIGRHWRAETLRVEWNRLQYSRAEARRRAPDPEGWRRDSAAMATRDSLFMRRRAFLPRQVARAQVLSHCAVGFEVRDTVHRRLKLFDARAWDWVEPGRVIAEGYAYRPGGYQPGDTAWLVFPNVHCGGLLIGAFGSAEPQKADSLRVRVR